MPVHGEGGAFGGLTVREAINALVQPSGLWGRLPSTLVRETHPQWAYVTGWGGTTGTEPTNQCGPCVTAGGVKSCVAILPFGRKCVASESLDAYTIRRRYNQGEFDIEVIGNLVSEEARQMFMEGNVDSRTLLEVGMAQAVYEVGLELSRWLTSRLWSGMPSASDNEGYAEFRGLDGLIVTGRVDALTGAECPNLDSVVYAYDNEYNEVDSGGSILVRTINRTFSVLNARAQAMGLAPVKWVMVTSPELRYLIMDMWAAAYTTAIGLQLPTPPSSYIVDLSASSANRDRILASGQINILGTPVEIIGDEGVPVEVDNGTATTSVYFVPLTYVGNRKATYLQFFDYRLPEADQLPYRFTYTDSGRVQWWITQNGPCWKLSGAIKVRPIIEVPHLAAKITGIEYTPDTALPFPVSGVGSGVGARTITPAGGWPYVGS